ncbi:ester cyclase [Streptomyces sp. MK37H]|uniref:ester cyclase n=1 Tax=Streptomyces sp. MK37H TaxID=2699117 RepID=UPI001B38EA7C|nr:ester cyclase [Streptomyces sp. MK37H]
MSRVPHLPERAALQRPSRLRARPRGAQRPDTIAGFQDLLRRDATEIPDLHYAIDRLLVQGEEVACRIRFDCTPAAGFRGLPPTGRPISFVEHGFYRYQDGRIAEIWSLIDMEAIREQLTGSSPDA